MPGGNARKQYVDNTYYHIYNRGVEKRVIFQDAQDYAVFLGYLEQYLLPKDEEEMNKLLSNPNTSYKEREDILRLFRLNNFADEITIVAYCLMPNHFHFLVYQKNADSIDKFMNSLATRYTQYFNKKYQRVGPLYQGVYKAVMVETDPQLLHLTRYIHKQALATSGQAWMPNAMGQPCSYPEYLGKRKTEWVHPEEILKFFSKNNPKNTYESFVKDQDDFEIVSKLTLEED